MNTQPLNIPKDIKIKALYLFFLIYELQVGVGLAGYPRIVFNEAGHDGWISLIIALIIVHIVVACIIFILKTYENYDLYGILEQTVGKWIGKIITAAFLLYFSMIFLSIIITYIEFVKVFLFPRVQGWFVALLLLLLVVYAILGGFRVVVGVSFLVFIGTIWMHLLLTEPASYIDTSNYFPILDSGIKEIASGVYVTAYSVLGFELLWFFYPFISDKNKVSRYSHLGVALNGITLLIITVVAIGYFSRNRLQEEIWPLLQMFKILQLPLFERFDIIVVSLWMLIILPNLVTLGWMITFGLKRMSRIKQKYSTYVLVSLMFVVCLFMDNNRFMIDAFTNLSAKIGLFFAFVFPFLLFPFALIKRMKGKKSNEKI
ncbi:GerAB/ArcD/ProY family transporter [Bacillaceae bacterium W0354]